MSPIQRLLIANRGEIACRIITTCQRLGIESVAVYSDADRNAKHVRLADRAYYLGPAPAKDSYLNVPALMRAVQQSGADAIHPGYGFLSESPELIQACEQAGLCFVGPRLESIVQMGSKIEAKRLAADLNLPILPGYNGEAQDDDTLASAAKTIGTPLLIKASSGGGGKGMRRVDDLKDFRTALHLARSEAQRAFGDNRVLLEKYIPRPRHIEVQILGDGHGGVIHLYDRECSIQRHYQKVIEEAPVSHLPESQRQQLFQHAMTLGHALQYRGAGTVEFVVDADTGEGFFLEMNTRLQVEHPTTEAITGVDLVAAQIHIAETHTLPHTQAEIRADGVAIEARINAEEPALGFLPQTGKVATFSWPEQTQLRIDSGVAAGDVVSAHYDALLAKAIAHADNRRDCTRRLRRGLQLLQIAGITTNVPFLCDVLHQRAFHDVLCTDFIPRHYPNGWQTSTPASLLALAATLAVQSSADTSPPLGPWQRLGTWRNVSSHNSRAHTCLYLTAPMCETLTIEHLVDGNGYALQHAGEDYLIKNIHQRGEGQSATVNGKVVDFQIQRQGTQLHLFSQMGNISISWQSMTEALLSETTTSTHSATNIYAPMTGRIADIHIADCDAVSPGQPAMILEAMKMLHSLPCPCEGQVVKLHVAPNDEVHEGQLLVEFSPTEEPIHP